MCRPTDLQLRLPSVDVVSRLVELLQLPLEERRGGRKDGREEGREEGRNIDDPKVCLCWDTLVKRCNHVINKLYVQVHIWL